MNDDLFLPYTLSAAEARRYADDGYLKLGRVVTDAGIAALREELLRARRDDAHAYDPTKTWLQNHLTMLVHRRPHCVALRAFFFRGPLVDVAERLIGPDLMGAATMLSLKERNTPQGVGWHQDNGYGELDPYTSVSAIVPLVDTDERNGCLWVVPGSHKQGQIDTRDRLSPEAKLAKVEVDVPVDDRLAIPLVMKAGEAAVFHCHTLHKSNGNATDEDRVFLYLRYADANSVEVYNERRPRLGRLLRGTTRFPEIAAFDADLT